MRIETTTHNVRNEHIADHPSTTPPQGVQNQDDEKFSPQHPKSHVEIRTQADYKQHGVQQLTTKNDNSEIQNPAIRNSKPDSTSRVSNALLDHNDDINMTDVVRRSASRRMRTSTSGTQAPPTKAARGELGPGTKDTDTPAAPTAAVPPSDDVIPRLGAVASNTTVIPRASAVIPMTTVNPRESVVTSMATATVNPRESVVTRRTTVMPRASAVNSMATPTATADKIVYDEKFYHKPKSPRNKRHKPPRDSFQHPHLTANTINHPLTSRIVQNVILHGMACAVSTTYNLHGERNYAQVPSDEEMCDEPDPSLHDDLNTSTRLRLRSVQSHKITKRLTERKLQEIQAKAWSVTVTKNDVIAAALRMRQGVAAGPDQVAPWLLRIAVEANHDQLIASMAASLFNKQGRGEFSAETGAIFCAGDGVGLFKTAKKKLSNQRPIVSSLSLRRWMCRAQAVNIRETLYPKVADHQLGVAPGGTQVAAHAMRHLRARCIREKKWIIALIDFKNAFNSFSRDLMLRQCAAHAPALLPVVQWLYSLPSDVMCRSGRIIECQSGTQQVCVFSNLVFALVIKFIEARTMTEGLAHQLFYWDDCALVGTPKAVAYAVDQIQQLTPHTNLELKYDKCHTYAPSKALYDEARALLCKAFNVYEDMNFEYLGIPIMDDDAAAEWFVAKTKEIKAVLDLFQQLEGRHEAFTLIKYCGAECKVNHLLASVPPRQTHKFIEHFDGEIRDQIRQIIDKPLSDVEWLRIKQPVFLGGMCLRTGMCSYYASYATSLMKTIAEVERVLGPCSCYDPHALAMCETFSQFAKCFGHEWSTNTLPRLLRSINPLRNQAFSTQLPPTIPTLGSKWETVVSNDSSFAILPPNAIPGDDDAPETKSPLGSSLRSRCETRRFTEIHHTLRQDPNAQLQFEASCGHNGHFWRGRLPLQYRGWLLESEVFAVAVKRCICADVISEHIDIVCPVCKSQFCDSKGYNQNACNLSNSFNTHHKQACNVISKRAAQKWKVTWEHSGDYDKKGDKFAKDAKHRKRSGKRPGDIAIHNMSPKYHADLIDYGRTHPMRQDSRAIACMYDGAG